MSSVSSVSNQAVDLLAPPQPAPVDVLFTPFANVMDQNFGQINNVNVRCFNVDEDTDRDACHAQSILVGSSVLLAYYHGDPIFFRRQTPPDEANPEGATVNDRRLYGSLNMERLQQLGELALAVCEKRRFFQNNLQVAGSNNKLPSLIVDVPNPAANV